MSGEERFKPYYGYARRAAFVGRFQPPHRGHLWLINQKLEEGVPCVILIRNVKPDAKNPLTANQVSLLLREIYAHDDVVVMVIPDICGVYYGRGVGYDVEELEPPDNIERISATEIRAMIRTSDPKWKELVPEAIHDHLEEMLS